MKKILQFNPTTDYDKQCENLYGKMLALNKQLSTKQTKKLKTKFESFDPHKDYYKFFLELYNKLQTLKENIKSQTETVSQ